MISSSDVIDDILFGLFKKSTTPNQTQPKNIATASIVVIVSTIPFDVWTAKDVVTQSPNDHYMASYLPVYLSKEGKVHAVGVTPDVINGQLLVLELSQFLKQTRFRNYYEIPLDNLNSK